MKYNIKRTDKFSKSFKKLAKKYKHITTDYGMLINSLESGDHNSTQVAENIYKIRMQNTSNSKGKSSGFRVI